MAHILLQIKIERMGISDWKSKDGKKWSLVIRNWK
jgi:hypothetical protein